jgi:hypothetical protein
MEVFMKHCYFVFAFIFLISCGEESDGDNFIPDDDDEFTLDGPPAPIWVSYPAATDNDLSVLNGAPIHGIFYGDHLLEWDFGGDPFSQGWTYELTITNRDNGFTTVLDAWDGYWLYKDDLGEALGYTITDGKSNEPLPDPMFFSMSIRGVDIEGEKGPPSEVLNFALLKNSFSFVYRNGAKVDSASRVGFGRGGAIGPSSVDEGSNPDDFWSSSYFTGPYGYYQATGSGPEIGSSWNVGFWFLHPPQVFMHHWNDTSTWDFDEETEQPYVTNGFEYTTNYDSYGMGLGWSFGEYKNNPEGLQTGFTQILGYNTYDVDGITVDVLELSFEGLYTWTSVDQNYSKSISGSGQFVLVGD